MSEVRAVRIFLKASPNHYDGRKGWKPDMICFHQTGGTSAAVAIQYYRNPASQCSPNYVIDTNGDIYQLVDLCNAAWANGTATKTSDKKYYGYSLSKIVRERKTNANYYTYSIEFVHCQWGNINEQQVAAAVNLINKVIIPHMRKNGVTPVIDREHLVGHSDITPKTRDPERYNCPGKQFPYDEIISRVLGKAPLKTAEPAAVFAVGDKVTIKDSATTYAGVSTKIPAGFKGSSKTYTVSRVMSDRVLLKELYSWVWVKDVERQ